MDLTPAGWEGVWSAFLNGESAWDREVGGETEGQNRFVPVHR